MRKACLLVVGLALLAAQTGFAANANITQIAFTNNPLTVAPGVISDRLTISTQNSGGTAETLSETADLELSSSSGTGEFSSSNTSWSSDNVLTMNNNSANRNFYYRDATEGGHTITAKVTTRTTGLSWTTTQVITVGAGGPSGSATSTGDSLADEGNSTDQVSGSAGGGSSAKTSPSGVFKVSAEIPRAASVQAPVDFSVVPDKGANNGARYYWSFGDGAVGRGAIVTHVYEFPGTYNVVLIAERDREKLTLRSAIDIVEPQLRISAVSPGPKGYIEIENPSGKEINLEGWQIGVAEDSFAFFGPTYLGPRQKLKLSNKISQLDPALDQTVAVNFPSQELATTHVSPSPARLAQAVENLKVAIAPVVPVSNPIRSVTSKPVPATPALAPATPPSQSAISQLAATVASGKTVILGEKVPEIKWWQKIFSR